jgi:hypothetical protein
MKAHKMEGKFCHYILYIIAYSAVYIISYNMLMTNPLLFPEESSDLNDMCDYRCRHCVNITNQMNVEYVWVY